MEIFLAIVFVAIGILLIIKGGDWFVDAASWIAKALKIPTFIIGATIVSFATTLPELIVSLIASVQNKNDMAVGNAIGSVTANTGLIMALAMIFMTITAPRKNYLQQCLLLVLAAGILWLGCLSGQLALWASLILLALFFTFMVLNVKQARQEPTVTTTEPMAVTKKLMFKNIFFFLLGAAAVILGSNLLINGGSTLATKLGVPERVIAVTMIAIGTSLPELVTTITAIKKKEANLSAGNIIGANIIDLTLILPVCSFVANGPFNISTACLTFDFPACFIVCSLAVMPLICKERSYKWQGIIMLLGYCAYIVVSSII